jgi:hypothetical protein
MTIIATMTPEESYAALVEELLRNPAVTHPKQRRGFGFGLRINNQVFAMFDKGKFVVKLPQSRVTKLIEAERGEPYVYGGRTAKEWLAVDPTLSESWLPLAQEALDFVAFNN